MHKIFMKHSQCTANERNSIFYPNRSSDQERLLKFEEKLETTFCTYKNSDDLEIV